MSSTDKDTPEPSATPPAASPARQAAPTSPPAPSPVVVTPAFTAAPVPPAGSGPPPGSVESGLAALVQVASADLAARLGINVAEVGLLEARSVVWPDGGLGCPEPGMAYQQVQVEGYLIRLAAGGQEYRYHGGGGRGPFLCEQPDAPQPPAPGPGDT